jgi:hypothetical protein
VPRFPLSSMNCMTRQRTASHDAAAALTKIGPEAAVPALVWALQAKHSGLRARVTPAIAMFGPNAKSLSSGTSGCRWRPVYSVS